MNNFVEGQKLCLIQSTAHYTHSIGACDSHCEFNQSLGDTDIWYTFGWCCVDIVWSATVTDKNIDGYFNGSWFGFKSTSPLIYFSSSTRQWDIR